MRRGVPGCVLVPFQLNEPHSTPVPTPHGRRSRARLCVVEHVGTALVALSLGVWPPAPAGAAEEVRVGVARETFELPRGVPLAGYSRRKGRPSSGVHDPVGVRALVIEQGDTTAALVSCDLLIVDEVLFEAVRGRSVADGLPPATVVLLAATHTHSGPGAYGTRFLEKLSMGHFDPQVFQALVARISRALVRAYHARQPARLAYQTVSLEGAVTNRVEAGGLVDADLIVSAWSDPAGRPLAIVVNFSAHPTTLGAWNREVSADYPGVVVRTVEDEVEGATCLFFSGAVGDQAPVKEGSGFEPAERLGRRIARRVVEVVGQLRPEPVKAVRARQDILPLPPARVRLGRRLTLPAWLGQRLVDDDATVSVIRAGPTVSVGVPCDLVASLGQQVKAHARARGFEPMVIGFASDYIGYCLPESLYETDAYEASLAFHGPRAGRLILERLTELLDDVEGGEAVPGRAATEVKSP